MDLLSVPVAASIATGKHLCLLKISYIFLAGTERNGKDLELVPKYRRIAVRHATSLHTAIGVFSTCCGITTKSSAKRSFTVVVSPEGTCGGSVLIQRIQSLVLKVRIYGDSYVLRY